MMACFIFLGFHNLSRITSFLSTGGLLGTLPRGNTGNLSFQRDSASIIFFNFYAKEREERAFISRAEV